MNEPSTIRECYLFWIRQFSSDHMRNKGLQKISHLKTDLMRQLSTVRLEVCELSSKRQVDACVQFYQLIHVPD